MRLHRAESRKMNSPYIPLTPGEKVIAESIAHFLVPDLPARRAPPVPTSGGGGLGPMDEYPTRTNDSAAGPRAPEILAAAAETFRSRNALYGDNYLRFGTVFLGMFPGGVLPRVTTPGDMDRLQLMMQALNKLLRYAESFKSGGHRDSARDLCVYAAMLEEVTYDER